MLVIPTPTALFVFLDSLLPFVSIPGHTRIPLTAPYDSCFCSFILMFRPHDFGLCIDSSSQSAFIDAIAKDRAGVCKKYKAKEGQVV